MKDYLSSVRLLLVSLALLLLAASAAPLLAQDPGVQAVEQAAYGLSWYSMDGGGALGSTGGAFALSGTAGQADAGGMGAGRYRLVGGFWAGLGVAVPFGLYLPLALR